MKSVSVDFLLKVKELLQNRGRNLKVTIYERLLDAINNDSIIDDSSVGRDTAWIIKKCNALLDIERNGVINLDIWERSATPIEPSIPTFEEVMKEAKRSNIPLQEAQAFFKWYDTHSWKDKGGKSIANWRGRLDDWNEIDKQQRKGYYKK